MLRFSPVNYVFGAPGSGKSTVLCYIARKAIKKGIRVYSNTPIEGTILIDDESIGYYNFEHSIILLDEAGLSYDNRKFKGGLMSDPARLQYWKLVRHYHSIIILATQGWDECDKKCRLLAQSYFLIKKSLLPWWTTICPIYKKVDIDPMTHQPCDFFTFDLPFHFKHVFRPKWYKYFDSFSAPALPDYPDSLNLIQPYMDKIIDVEEDTASSDSEAVD